MDRRTIILDGIERHQSGIEVAPYFAPLAPKRDGYKVAIVDVFDRETLLERAREDPEIPPSSYENIEDVDYVGSATEICDLVPEHLHGSFDYLVSSHNFEHLPNPIKFLQGCEILLKPGGLVSMAVPDGRACFDYFRPHTVIGDWLQAYFEDRRRPSPRQVFDLNALRAVARIERCDAGCFPLNTDPEIVATIGDLGASYRLWLDSDGSTGYEDAHCTVMSPASFELLITECRHLGLLTLEIESISETLGCEFYVRLRNNKRPCTNRPVAEINDIRSRLMRRVWEERALPVKVGPAEIISRQGIITRAKWNRLAKKIVGENVFKSVVSWNRERLRRRRSRA